ncbi:FHA domain-containing protein [Pseudosulfitobacter pseudonitzschiae]|uniref:FHA domain-containing protein n=1 Tax=Pseudosulfitobacter pseudonitzschiae TaxID=1402135 RepID=UPI001AF434FB|nr:FHA domain-containing protein [Pseudosulfitobacter pseudonitzschiae]MBM1814799.1 FHA domain-containing protein [Pseudosulfitobacter pseudonitzschiae]MBM1831793.1 FHA domain-containing protein [Pseudosulfitobacter pseudonitzschiae]MBM1836658.1 FHA domain-containing protein [Pseudosulfitobacter pseudonitzschiae]MBM1841505.1 FHA domain-containing protein [Pseudosulfitobacter pseudonitzschiae]MBM1846372.1 FHA domain-containing protein [Pseudosulfitobacter pseudonitzschiae]
MADNTFFRAPKAVALLTALALWLPQVSTAQTAPLDCRATEDGGHDCTVFFPGGTDITQTTLTLSDGTEVAHSFTAEPTELQAPDADTPRVLFLAFDTSNPARAAILRQSLDSAWALVELVPPQTPIGLGTFDENFAEVQAPTTDRDVLQQAIAGIQANGQTTNLYEATLDILNILPAAPDGRRDIVLFSDGNAEDTAFTLQDVSERARKMGVRVNGLGAVLRASETKYTQTLERMAEETGGLYFGTAPGNANFATEDLSRIAQLGEGVGVVSFDAGFVREGTLVLTTATGRSLRYQIAPVGPDAAEEEAAREPQQEPAASLIDNIPLAGWIAGGALLFLILLLGLRGRRKPPQPEIAEPDPTPMPDPVPTPDPVKVYGVLTTVNGEDLYLTSSISTLGRSGDADIVLDDPSVSRRHATLSVTGDGAMQIVDLNSLNGVLVNGTRVTSAEVKAGDTLQLGEVSLTFGYPND